MRHWRTRLEEDDFQKGELGGGGRGRGARGGRGGRGRTISSLIFCLWKWSQKGGDVSNEYVGKVRPGSATKDRTSLARHRNGKPIVSSIYESLGSTVRPMEIAQLASSKTFALES